MSRTKFEIGLGIWYNLRSMVVAKEAGPLYSETPETPKRESNSFVQFLGQNIGQLHRYSSLTYELRDEEEGWKNSSTSDEIANKFLDLMSPFLPDILNNKQLRKISRQIRENVLQMIFRHPNEQENLVEKHIRNSFSLKGNVNGQQERRIIAMYEEITEFNRDFHQAKAPIVEEIRGSKAELSSRFKDYLLSDPFGIFSFRDFLLDRKHASDREAIRPFLASLAETEDRLARERKEGVFLQCVRR
jgi:hypothetical protein